MLIEENQKSELAFILLFAAAFFVLAYFENVLMMV